MALGSTVVINYLLSPIAKLFRDQNPDQETPKVTAAYIQEAINSPLHPIKTALHIASILYRSQTIVEQQIQRILHARTVADAAEKSQTEADQAKLNIPFPDTYNTLFDKTIENETSCNKLLKDINDLIKKQEKLWDTFIKHVQPFVNNIRNLFKEKGATNISPEVIIKQTLTAVQLTRERTHLEDVRKEKGRLFSTKENSRLEKLKNLTQTDLLCYGLERNDPFHRVIEQCSTEEIQGLDIDTFLKDSIKTLDEMVAITDETDKINMEPAQTQFDTKLLEKHLDKVKLALQRQAREGETPTPKPDITPQQPTTGD